MEFEISLDGGATFNPVSGCSTQAASWSLANSLGHLVAMHAALSAGRLERSVEGRLFGRCQLRDLDLASVNPDGQRGAPLRRPSVPTPTRRSVARPSTTPPPSLSLLREVTARRRPALSISGTPPTVGDTWNDITGCTAQNLVWDSGIHTGTATCATAFAETSTGGPGSGRLLG